VSFKISNFTILARAILFEEAKIASASGERHEQAKTSIDKNRKKILSIS